MFQKVFEYAGPHKKGLYAATAIVLVSVLLGVFPFVLAYQVIAPLVMGEAITASFIIQHVILVLVCLVLQALFYGWGLNLSHKAAYDTLLRLRTALQKRFEKTAAGCYSGQRHWHREKAVRGRCRQSGSSAGTLYAGGHRQPDGSYCSLCGNVLCRLEAGTVIFGIHSA